MWYRLLSPDSSRTRCRRVTSIVVAAGAASLVTVIPTTTAVAAAAKVTICHQTGNLSYVLETVDVNSVSGGGHGHHDGDIIPAFNVQQGNREIHFPGRNLGELRAADRLTGAHVLAAGCAVPGLVATTQQVPPTSGAVAVPTPTDTLAPTPTTQAVPTPTGSAVPTTGVQTTDAPDTTGPPPTPTATPAPRPTPAPTPTSSSPTSAPVPTSGPVATPAPTSTLAPTPTTSPDCPDGELAHAGACFAVPPLVIEPTPSLPTLTAQPEAASLTPLVECVDNRSDGISVTWFSYQSTADSAVVVERGPANQLTPIGTPPTLFGPGLHIFVVAVETTDGVASWTLAGTTATSNEDSPECSSALTTGTTGPVTTEPGTTAPATTPTDEPDTPQSGGGQPGTTQPPTTQPGATTPGTADGCRSGETEIDGECTPVEPVRLVLVDNVLECDGHGVARFAAFNDNVFALDADNATSLVSPLRLAEDAPEVIDERDIVADDGSETAALFTVRYVTSVTWTVSHHGLEASISAGVGGAAPDPACPEAIVNSAGAHGLLGTPAPLATTGPGDAVPVAVLAALISAIGLGLVMAARRRPPAMH